MLLGAVRRAAVESVCPPAIGFTVLFPSRGGPRAADAARRLVEGVRLIAQGAAGTRVGVVAADVVTRRLWCAETVRPLALSTLARSRVTVLLNPAFLLADPPPLGDLIGAGQQHGVAWCASRITGDVYAVAARTRELAGETLWSFLRLLTACVDDDVDPRAMLEGAPLLAPASSSAENSPALAGIAGVRGRRAFDAPPYVNTAFREILDAPEDRGAVGSRPEHMAAALLAQRDASRVPWIFNALVNDVEYRLGDPHPASVPPEVHLSITGFCNIECRFCAYEHRFARTDFVGIDDVARMDVLRFAQTFRLHSGLGEPTTNPHLPGIIDHVARRFPHVGMNFFTNAVTFGRRGLLDAMVGNVRWINASINAAGPASWQDVCNADLFDRVCRNLADLHAAKRAQGTLLPLVFGSMVLTRANLEDLPRMPALCRRLGVDRFSAFPYFGLGYHGRDKYGPEMTLASCRDRYDELYWTTVKEAEAHAVSLEIPLPSPHRRTAFGVEARSLHDFARIESNQWRLGRFVAELDYAAASGAYCHFLWRSAGIGSTSNTGHAGDVTHYLYPCIGPLSSVDLSRRTAFRFPDAEGFSHLWRNPVFTKLRHAQREPGVSPVCDACRSADTRDPQHFPRLERLVADFAREHSGATQDDGGGIST